MLTLQTGGLSNDVLKGVLESQLPNLYHLELWFGSADYGLNVDFRLLHILFDKNERGLFPSLEYLGIRDLEGVNQICEYVADSAILSRIRILDMSLGDMDSSGAKELIRIKDREDLLLEVLDLHHHFIFDNDVITELSKLPVIVILTDVQECDGYRYVALAE
jgi:hypothetical protein